jgi:DNA-binding PadR family transcriptional regulator
MSRKVSDDIIFKELGSLQEKVLFYLAENPDNHKQGIQQGIAHPTDQYGSISKAVDALEKFGYIESKEGISQKKVPIKLYHCTESGVFCALTKNQSANVLRILDSYKLRVKFCDSFRQLYDAWGHEHFIMYLRDIGYALPIIQKNGIEAAMPILLMKILEEMKKIDKKTRTKNAKAALGLFPESKKWLTEWKNNLDELI